MISAPFSTVRLMCECLNVLNRHRSGKEGKALIEEISRRVEVTTAKSQDTPKASKVTGKMHAASDSVEKKHVNVSKLIKTSKSI